MDIRLFVCDKNHIGEIVDPDPGSVPLKVGEFFECCRIGDVDLLASQFDPALFGKAFEQAADDLPRAAEFVGQSLMGGVDRAGLVDQEICQALVQLLNCVSSESMGEINGAKKNVASDGRTRHARMKQRNLHSSK